MLWLCAYVLLSVKLLKTIVLLVFCNWKQYICLICLYSVIPYLFYYKCAASKLRINVHVYMQNEYISQSGHVWWYNHLKSSYYLYSQMTLYTKIIRHIFTSYFYNNLVPEIFGEFGKFDQCLWICHTLTVIVYFCDIVISLDCYASHSLGWWTGLLIHIHI